MNDAVPEDSDVSVLERFDWFPAFDAARKERINGPRDGLENRIVVAHGREG